MKITLTQVQGWFDYYNNLVFGGKLPRVPIKLNNTRRQLGQFYWGVSRGIGIKISTYYDRPESEYKNTIVHEMCHLYCYNRGWKNEHHGPRWRAIADKASRITGFNIQRLHDGVNEWKVATKNKERDKAVKAKKEAPSLVVVLEYSNYYFVVKTSVNVLMSDKCTTKDGRLRTNAKASKVYISKDPLFRTFQSSRSLHRGYKYGFIEFVNRVAPKLKGAVEVTDIPSLFLGRYNQHLK